MRRTSYQYQASIFSVGKPWILAVLLGVLTLVFINNPITASVKALEVGGLDRPLQGLPPFTNGRHSLKGGESHSYRLSLNAGQFIYAVVEQQGIDVSVNVTRDGSKADVIDSPNDRWGTEPVLLIAQAATDYRIEVQAPDSKAPSGFYEIKIIALRAATPTDVGHVAAQRTFQEAFELRSKPTLPAQRASIEKFRQSVNLFEAAGDTYRRALALQMIGTATFQLNEYRSALKILEEALKVSQTIGEQRLEASIETQIGGALEIVGELKSSREHYEHAIEVARQIQNTSIEASSFNNIGKLYHDRGDFQTALDYYLKALPLLQDIPNRQAITLNNIGVAYNSLGEPDKAINYLRQSLSLLQPNVDKNAESYALHNLATAYRDQGRYDEALNYYTQARAIQQKTGNRAQEAETLDLIGVTYSSMGQPDKAIEYHQQALEIQRANKNVRREALSLSNLGHVYSLLNQPDKAVDNFDQALTIFRTIADLHNTAAALEGRARAKQQQGDLLDARKNIEESLNLIETVRAHSGSQTLRAAYLASREKAYEFYVDLLMQLHLKGPAAGHDGEAFQASERGRARSLMELLNETRVDISEGVGADLIKRDRELRQGLNAKAQRVTQLTALNGSRQEIETLNKEISSLEDEHEQLQVRIRKASPAYAALTQPQPLSLHEIQQQLDANTLLLEYSLGDARSYLWAVTQDSMKSYELPKRDDIQKLARQLYESLTARSVTKSLETSAQRAERTAQADLQVQQSAVELSKMILAPAAAELGTKRLVVVADGALQYVPFAVLAAGQSSVVSSPWSAAQRAHFEALGYPRPLPADKAPSLNYRPLILDHEVVTLPSASALAVQRRNLASRKPAPKALAVIADPVFSPTDARLNAGSRTLRPRDEGQQSSTNSTRIIEHLVDKSTGELAIRRLPFTRNEADQILSVSPSTTNLRAFGFRANLTTATSGELSNYRYVHFATHGYLDSERPNLSALVLSLVDEQGVPQDGFLRAIDIYNLKLPAELVVLSACETGLGKEVRGEGLVGLTQGFMSAGARRVIVSLWNVNDKATAVLMGRLYTGMLKTHKTPSAALRAAQIEMLQLKQWQSPYYWAAFVMQGEWQ